MAQAPSNELLTNTAGKPEKANLAIRCSDKGFFFTFVWPDYVNADTYDAKVIDVDFKLDGGKVHEAKFSKADQGAVALGKTGYKMLKDVVKGQTLSVHLPDFHGGQDATFPIKGIEAIYARISAQGCGKN